MSKYAEQIMGILIILMAAIVFFSLAGERESVCLTDTQAVNIMRAVIAPIFALAVGILAYVGRNYKSR